jgi:hypothetical protein
MEEFQDVNEPSINCYIFYNYNCTYGNSIYQGSISMLGVIAGLAIGSAFSKEKQ